MSQKKKILVIDDDVQLVDMVKTLLEGVGYEVCYAYQSEKGIEMAKTERPDLILLDVMFAGPPGPDGLEVSRRISKAPGLDSIPVIILSGVKKALELNMDLNPDEIWMPVKAFIEKPVKPDKLLAEIEKVLGPRPSQS